MNDYDSGNLLLQIRDILARILDRQERLIFFPLSNPDGSISFVNLSLATEIHLVSDEECRIRFGLGSVITVTTKQWVDAVIQAIRKEVVSIEKLPTDPTAPKQQAQNK